MGANNAGKTTLLRDLYTQAVHSTNISSSYEEIIKWRDILPQQFFTSTKSEFKRFQNSLRALQGQQPTVYASVEDMTRDGRFFINDSVYESLTANLKNYDIARLESSYGVYLKAAKFVPVWIENRFTLSQQGSVQNFDLDSNQLNIPSFLARTEEVYDRFNGYLMSFFSKRAYYQPHLIPTIEIVFGDEGASPISEYKPFQTKESFDSYQKWKTENNLAQMDGSFGHGIRAAAEVLFRLALNSDVYFMDEPELHLYPETKRRLGSLISSLAPKKQFFIVTHDVDFLDGLLATSDRFDVIRINNKKQLEFYDFSGENLEAIRSSKRNSDAVRAAFHDYAIYVEGVKDKYLYEGAINNDHLLDDASSIVVPCHGNYRVQEFLPISRELNIKAAVITDFDTIKGMHGEAYILHQIIDNLIKDIDKANSLKATHLQIYEKISGADNVWTQGLNAIQDPSLQSEVRSFVDELKATGIFVIPIGALEAWFQTTKEIEVEELLRRYKFTPKKKYLELRLFLKEVTNYLLDA